MLTYCSWSYEKKMPQNTHIQTKKTEFSVHIVNLDLNCIAVLCCPVPSLASLSKNIFSFNLS